ncbi:hypothetical protein GQF61_13740 [Sphingobacterium sp. DK4209]|uniref:Peptidase M56 domain-containing protein n=2 Tax=Sphingobacterium zhuxiongii TaxID=2662364 RepID=A0A5Q0Q8W4_9SPHI|nr:hypothetical protein [Sphingobacterium sp. DK4209]QGA25559.1 hypothetical protein GFH32_04160 [Sphingobacterium sp. dk4302]
MSVCNYFETKVKRELTGILPYSEVSVTKFIPFIFLKKWEIMPNKAVLMLAERIQEVYPINQSARAIEVPVNPPEVQTQEPNINWTSLPKYLYFLGVLIFLIRFNRNLFVFFKLTRKYRIVSDDGCKIVLLPYTTGPFSFLNYVFIADKDYNKGLSPLVWKHELAHVKQKHSIDVLFSELMLCFSFFNPINYFIIRAIKLNHEYLADEYVVKNKEDISVYQYLLTGLKPLSSGPSISSQLNYKQIKNRLIMMKKTEKKRNKVYMLSLTCVLLAGSLLLFSNKSPEITSEVRVTKLVDEDLPINVEQQQDTSRKREASKELLDEYDRAFKKLTIDPKTGKTKRWVNMADVDSRRMAYIASLMSAEQVKQRTHYGANNHLVSPEPKTFILMETKPVKRSPSTEQWKKWKNASVYGVWIDGKKVPNTALDKYKASDVVHYNVSKLYANAKKGKSYTHQLIINTEPYYNKIYGNRLF